MAKTIHVFKFDEGWAVKREGKAGSVHSTKKDAVSSALTLVKKSASGQMVVHGRDGTITDRVTRGLPKVQRPPGRSRLGARRIAKAVGKVVLARLKADPLGIAPAPRA
ncbi:MAG: DUF2188 domain-containing protein [Bryobacteraceae bacterium]